MCCSTTSQRLWTTSGGLAPSGLTEIQKARDHAYKPHSHVIHSCVCVRFYKYKYKYILYIIYILYLRMYM